MNRRLRLLHVTGSYFPDLGGGGQATKVRGLARALLNRGHDVTVLTTEPRSTPPGSPRAAEAVYLPAWFRYRGTAFCPGVLDFCRRRLSDLSVVHLYGLYDPLGAVVAVFCRRRRIPYVIEPIGMYPPIVRSLWKKRLFMRLVGRRLLEGAAAVVATSEFERAALLRSSLPAEKIVVRRNGLDMDELRPLPPRGRFRRALGVPAEAPLVLSLGRISRKKGLDLLVRAFATLPSSARLAIVGPDDGDGCAGELRRLAVEEGLTDRIVFRGAVEGGERLAAYADADVFVLPSRNENFGNVAAEAAVCGVPVVVTDRCGVAPLIENRAGIVVPCDEAAIGVAMRRLLGDDGLRERLRRGGFVLGDELSWVEPVKEMERLYERLSEPALALRRAQGERIFDGCTEASKRSG